jgi:flagellar protein FlaG
MVDPISNTPGAIDFTSSQNRAQPSPTTAGAAAPVTNLAPFQRIEALQGAVEKLIKKSLPSNSRLQIEQDKNTGTFIYRSINPETGEVIQQWPSEKLLEMRDFLKELDGVLLDKQV